MNSLKRAMLLLASALGLLPVSTMAAQRLELVERALSDTTLDLGAKGDSLGDLLTFANPVFDAADKTELGSDQGFCIRVVVGKSYECFWTLLLKDGEITAEGPFYDDKDSVMVVTGGTGKYLGAKGALKLHARDAKGSSYQFIYDLL